MAAGASARRYAQAAFQIAREKDELDGWLDDLAVLARAAEDPEFVGLLNAPQLPLARKQEVIQNVMGGAVGPLAVNLISLLASRNAADLMPAIVDQYQRLLDAHRGIERAEVVSAVPLGEDQSRKLESILQDVVGAEIRLTSRVESGILGGLIARVGDKVIDGSTATRLQDMRKELIGQD